MKITKVTPQVAYIESCTSELSFTGREFEKLVAVRTKEIKTMYKGLDTREVIEELNHLTGYLQKRRTMATVTGCEKVEKDLTVYIHAAYRLKQKCDNIVKQNNLYAGTYNGH